jgi:endonuclease/exonuclease/phosphatase family metal-dependent hydrolase
VAPNEANQAMNALHSGQQRLAGSAAMTKLRKRLLLILLAPLPLIGAGLWSARTARSDELKLATWNMEWLVTPATAHAARLACRRGKQAALPCDVVQTLARDSADLRRLAGYVRELDADIIAFQEVENAAIATQVFHGYRICMAAGRGVQQVGFAIRPHVPHRCGPVIEALALQGRNRAGMSLLLAPGSPQAVELLVVHLKSGCSREPLDADTAACQLLAQQGLLLGQWIAARSARGLPFIVLGDLNRVAAPSQDDRFWELLHADAFETVAQRLPFRNCYLGQPYGDFIDHILIDRQLLPRLGTQLHRLVFRNEDVVRYRLSDHCPVSISLKTLIRR